MVRYTVRYTVGNLVLYQLTYRPNENFEHGYPHSNAFLQFELKLER